MFALSHFEPSFPFPFLQSGDGSEMTRDRHVAGSNGHPPVLTSLDSWQQSKLSTTLFFFSHPLTAISTQSLVTLLPWQLLRTCLALPPLMDLYMLKFPKNWFYSFCFLGLHCSSKCLHIYLWLQITISQSVFHGPACTRITCRGWGGAGSRVGEGVLKFRFPGPIPSLPN